MTRTPSGRRVLAGAAAILALLAASCGGDTVPEPPPQCASLGGIWRGTLVEATSGSFGEAVTDLQQSGCALTGSWSASFNSGTANSGTLAGSALANTSTADFRLTSTADAQCPLSVTVSVQNGEAQGTYASVDCPVLSTGAARLYRDGGPNPYNPSPPAPPSGVVATAGNGQVTLRWPRVFGASGHNVYWSTSPGVTPTTGSKVARVAEPATITGLANGTPYYFIVTAQNMGGEGVSSTEVIATPALLAPNPPAGVAAAPGVGQVTVAWQAVDGAAGYSLYWSTTPGQAFGSGTRVAGVSSPYVLGGLANGMIYFIVVTAANAAGESAPSGEARAAPYSTEGYNFETGTLPGWTATGSWAVVSSTARSGVYSVADSPAGHYADNTDSSLVSPALNLTGRFVYVANFGFPADISQYTIGANGALLPMPAPQVPAGMYWGHAVAVDPAGKFAYATNEYDGKVFQYAIGADGGLRPLAPAEVAAPGAYAIAVHPSGRYAYVTNQGGSAVLQFSIGADGALAPLPSASIATGLWPTSIAIDPTGQYAYVANIYHTDDSVSQYTIGADGALAPLDPPAVTVAEGQSPNAVAVDPSGRYVYVANYGSNNVSQFTIGTNGALAPMAPATVAAGGAPRSVSVDPTGRYAYVAQDGGNVSQFTVGANGTLAPMTPAAVAAGSSSAAMTVDPSGRYAYVANVGASTVSQYSIGATGALTPIVPATVAAGTGPVSVAVAPYRSRSPVFTFWHRYELEFGRDFVRVEITSDAGANWTTLRTFTGSQTTWTAETIGLQDYAAPEVRIRFRLTSDGAGTADGWYVDDIVVHH